ncbi:hypothetical protein, partial [Kaarinaea lacus]
DIQNPNNNNMTQAPINSGVNNGDFYIHWTTRNEGELYGVDIYVSTDAQLSEQSDVNFFSDNCLGYDDCERNPSSNLACNYDGSTLNTIRCGREIGDSFRGTDVSSVVTGSVLTQGAYIIIKTCNVAEVSCGTSSHAVFFE